MLCLTPNQTETNKHYTEIGLSHIKAVFSCTITSWISKRKLVKGISYDDDGDVDVFGDVVVAVWVLPRHRNQ